MQQSSIYTAGPILGRAVETSPRCRRPGRCRLVSPLPSAANLLGLSEFQQSVLAALPLHDAVRPEFASARDERLPQLANAGHLADEYFAGLEEPLRVTSDANPGRSATKNDVARQ